MKSAIILSNNKGRENGIYYFFLATVGFLSAQRFTLPELSPYFSLFPLFFWVLFTLYMQRKAGLDLVIISAFASIDLGGAVYQETSIVVRFLLYALILFYILKFTHLADFRKIIISTFLVSFALLNTIYHEPIYFTYQFFRDVLILILVILMINLRRSDDLIVSPESIVLFSIGLLLSECLNIIFWYFQDSGSYLNYSSLKFVVCAPILYYVALRRHILLLMLTLPLALWVISSYNSRMLLLTFIIVSSLILTRLTARNIILLILFLTLCQLILIDKFMLQALDSNRVFGMFIHLLENDSIFDLLKILDPVRYTENLLFFSQSNSDIFFGKGLGAALYDQLGILSSVADDGSSFSDKELLSANYYVLHDSWLWFGLRFGLLAYIIILYWGVRQCFADDSVRRFWSAMFLLAFFNSSFSIIGLFISTVFAIQLIMRGQLKFEVRYR